MGGLVVSIQGLIAAQTAAIGGQGTYYSIQQLQVAQQAAQHSAENILQQAMINSLLINLSSQSLSQLAAAPIHSDSSKERNELLKLVSPLILKATRYLDKFEQAELFVELGHAYEQLGKRKAAIQFYQEALCLIEIQRSTISTESQRISFFSLKENIYKNLVRLLIADGKKEAAFEYVERSKSRAFLDILGYKGLLTLKSQEETSVFSSEMIKKEEISSLLDQTNLNIEQVRTITGREGQTPYQQRLDLDSLIQMNTINIEEALGLSREGLSVLEYFVGDNSLYIFLFDNGRLFVREISLSRRTLINLVSTFRKRITSRNLEFQEEQDPSERLYEILIAPIRPILTSQRLCIIPHDSLHYIPFQALRNQGRYLMEDIAISYCPSMTILKLCLMEGKRRQDSILVLANPLLTESNRLPPLHHAEEEALTVGKAFTHKKILIGKEAGEGSFKESASQYDIIHIAAHAFFDEGSPLDSIIFLAADGQNNGRLTAGEMFQIETNASLIVLSACETGLGRLSKGDELIGFVRAFMYSGSKSILSTLWSVDDESTSLFMKIFYDNLRSSAKDVALQKAQKEMLKHFSHPYYWAPFILTGNHG